MKALRLSLSLTSGMAPALALDFLSGSLDARVTFTRGSTGTYFNSSGVLSSAAINTPRFDYDPVTLAPKGLLIEEARTNLVLYSEAFDTGANWPNVNIAVTANASTSPSGAANADRATIVASSLYTFLRQIITVTASTTYTFTFWMNTTTSAAGNTIRIFNVTGGTDIVAGQACVYSGGWVRQVCTFTTPVGCTSIAVYPVSLNAGGSSAGTYFDIWGAQLEAGAFATSYIPTVASTVTRSADVATMTGTNFSGWYNQSAGTFVVGLTPKGVPVGAANVRFLEVNDGTGNNRNPLFYSSSTGSTYTQYRVAGVDQASLSAGAGYFAANTTIAIGTAYATNDFASSFSGGTVQTDTTGSVVSGATQMTIGYATSGSGTEVFCGHIRSIAYYNTRLPNTQLQALTA